MNFKKISVASIGLAALLFSCGGKKELKREEMQNEIDKNFKIENIKVKYSAGKKVEVIGKVEGEDIKELFTLVENSVQQDPEDGWIIKLSDTFTMKILDSVNEFPDSAQFYKINNGYLVTIKSDDVVGEVTFDNDLVSTSMKTTTEGVTQNLTFTYKG